MSNQNTPRPASGGVSPSAQGASHPSAALAAGAIFAGRYRIVRCMAAGGMGSVYEVVHTETDRRRALKVMHPHLFQSEEMRDRFKREARIAAQLQSEHIVDVADAGVDEATKAPFLVMELLEGEELGDRLKRVGALPPAEVVEYVQQAARALDKTHAKAIVHRDLKPENLFLTRRENGTPLVKILDFGVAKIVAEGATGAGATKSLGTPLYMAPEQFRIGTKLLPSVDIYALGMTAYTLLAGEPYWGPEARASGDVIAFAMAAIRGPVESAVKRAAARGVVLPAGFDAWFARATSVNPAQRFATASELARALGSVFSIVSGVTTAAPAAPPDAFAVSSVQAPSGSVPAAPPANVLSVTAPSQPFGLTAHTPGGAALGVPGAVGIGPGTVVAQSAPFHQGSSGGSVPLPPAPIPGATTGDGALARASSSMGATVSPVGAPPAARSRAPVIAAVVVAGALLLGIGGWLRIRVVDTDTPSAATGVVSSSQPSTGTARPVVVPQAEAPAVTPVPVSSTAPEPVTSPASSPLPTPQPRASAPTAAPKPPQPTATPKPQPTATPSAAPSVTPSAPAQAAPTSLLGRD